MTDEKVLRINAMIIVSFCVLLPIALIVFSWIVWE